MQKLKIITAGILLATSIQVTNGQNPTNTVTQPTSFINLGPGVGTPYTGNIANLKSDLPINPVLTVERAASSPSVKPINNADEILDLIKNNITIGGSIAYGTKKFSYYGTDYKYTLLYISARSSFHILKGKSIDPYIGIGLGYVAVFTNIPNYGVASALVGGFGYSFYGGVRIKTSGRFGFYGEVGYTSLSIVNAGITFDLGKKIKK